MDWGKIGDFLLKNGLPLLGTVLGGPAGGAVGGMIAHALGADSGTPDAVMAKLQADPDALLKLKTLQENNAQELQKLTLQGEIDNRKDVNETLRTEVASNDAYVRRARPSMVYTICFCVIVEVLIGGAVALLVPQHLADLAKLYEALSVPMTTALAVIGVYVKQRTNEKTLDAGVTPGPGLFSVLASRFAGKS